MKIFAIDYGLERTGLACSDPDGILAYPVATLHLSRYQNRKAFLADLTQIIVQHNPEAVVIGLPLLADGSDSLTTRQVRNFSQRLQRRIPYPCYFVEEFLSSEEAYDDLRALGIKKKNIKAILDQQAAVRILESCLQSPGSMQPVPAPKA